MTEDEISVQRPDLYERLTPLLRKSNDLLDVLMQEVSVKDSILGTKGIAHCYFISIDSHHRPRINSFAKFLATKVTDFSIPRSQILKALREAIEQNSTAPIDKLNMKARSLFNTQPRSGEGGEVLLSVLAESYLGLPQLFSKMTLKTNAEMPVHGSDGIHAGVNDNGHLALYWGESKLYADVSDAIGECLDSLAPFLVTEDGAISSADRDLELVRDGIDLQDVDLEKAIKEYLDPDSPMFNQVEFRGLCLIAFNSDHYPTLTNKRAVNDVKDEMIKAFEGLRRSFGNRCVNRTLDTFVIEVFFLPMPDVEVFRKAFHSSLRQP